MGSRINRELTAALVRERLADTTQPDDPLAVRLSKAVPKWPRQARERILEDLRPAGVLIPLIETERGLTVLLTQRSAALRHHAGQISFPGGSMEQTDADIRATALRETWEEVGISPSLIETVGYLAPMPTITGFAVTAVVGILPADIEVRIDRTEVEEAFDVPLEFLMNADNQRFTEREFWGSRLKIIEYRYDDRRIWGATAMMIAELRRKVFINRD